MVICLADDSSVTGGDGAGDGHCGMVWHNNDDTGVVNKGIIRERSTNGRTPSNTGYCAGTFNPLFKIGGQGMDTGNGEAADLGDEFSTIPRGHQLGRFFDTKYMNNPGLKHIPSDYPSSLTSSTSPYPIIAHYPGGPRYYNNNDSPWGNTNEINSSADNEIKNYNWSDYGIKFPMTGGPDDSYSHYGDFSGGDHSSTPISDNGGGENVDYSF